MTRKALSRTTEITMKTANDVGFSAMLVAAAMATVVASVGCVSGLSLKPTRVVEINKQKTTVPLQINEAKRIGRYARDNNLAVVTFDLNDDGIPDVYKLMSRSPDDSASVSGSAANAQPSSLADAPRLIRKEVDLNHDGRIDMYRIYDEGGLVTEESSDLDFDGRHDTRSVYAGGIMVRREADLNYDGTPDIIRTYDAEKLKMVETDSDGNGKIDTWEYFEGGKLDRIGTDTNGDGIIDEWQRENPSLAEPPEDESDSTDEGDADSAETPQE